MKPMLLVFAISIALCMSALVLGASAEPTKYDTPDGTITFNLPDGYFMNVEEPFSEDKAFVLDDGTGWTLEAIKGSDKKLNSYYLTVYANDADTYEGGADRAFDSMVDISTENNPDTLEGSYTKTASGQTIWIGIGRGKNEGFNIAFIDSVEDINKIIYVNLRPWSDSTQPIAGMTADQFKEFVESISIE